MRNSSKKLDYSTPWLGKIPGLKRLFGSSREQETKTELVICCGRSSSTTMTTGRNHPAGGRSLDRARRRGAPVGASVAPEPRKRVRLGDLLLEKKLISEQQLKESARGATQQRPQARRVLIDIGAVSEADLHGTLATALNIPYVDLSHMALDPKVVAKLPETQARRHRALILKRMRAVTSSAWPTPPISLRSTSSRACLANRSGLRSRRKAALLRTIDLAYRRTEEIVSLAEELDDELSEADVDLQALAAEEGSPDAPVIKLIQSMFQDAVRVAASDIHIEPDERCLRIRLRVDGFLQEQIIDGSRVGQALVTRLKLMCGLDIAEKRKPQDGRFSIKVEDKSLDVRASTMPLYHGEAIVLRLLDHSSSQKTFSELGMPEDIIGRFTPLIERGAGLVLVTGPTGSGKRPRCMRRCTI